MDESLKARKGTVLVVDDDDCMRGLLKLHLANAGYEVVVAEDAIVAGHIALQAPPALMIVDVNMPFMNGYEFVAALKADQSTCDIPIVFLTSRNDVPDEAKRLGAVAYLNKPVVADRLLEVVQLYA